MTGLSVNCIRSLATAVGLLLIINVASFLPANALASGLNNVQVGLLFDVDNEISGQFTLALRNEVSDLLGNQYEISLPDSKIRIAQWSSENVMAHYNELAKDPEVDIVVAAGALSASVLSKLSVYSKPLIVLGLVDYKLQGVVLSGDEASNVHNLVYVIETRSFDSDLQDFYSIYPYQNLVLLADRKIIELLPDNGESLMGFARSKGEATLVTYDDGMDSLFDKIPESTDAVMIGGLYRLTTSQRQELIARINEQKLPSYSFLGIGDVKMGVMAGASPEANWQKITRRIALNIERFLDGENPSGMESLVRLDRRLTINMQTAHQIGFSPNWAALANSELFNADSVKLGDQLDFQSVVERALQVNLSVESEQFTVDSAAEDVAQARAQFMPRVGASVSGVTVDEDSAGAFQAENTYSGSVTVDQLVFSEPSYANLSIQKHVYDSAKEKYKGVLYDTVLNAGLGYLDILKAQSSVTTSRNNLRLVRRNLDVADYRFKVGYAGTADVYRLRSELSSATSGLLEAESRLTKVRLKLNEILNEPLNRKFNLKDVSMSGDLMRRYGGDQVRASINTPEDMEKLTQFLVTEAMNKLPEISMMKDALAVQERILLSAQRQRWLPTVSVRGKADQVFERSGTGASLMDDSQSSWNISVAASWELFAGGEINSEIRQATAERDKLQKDLLNTKRNMELALRNAMLDLRVKSSNIDLFSSSASAAQSNYELVQDLYEQGRTTITALLDARTAALSSELSAANSVYDFYASVLQLERAMGDFSILNPEEAQRAFYNRLKSFMGAQ